MVKLEKSDSGILVSCDIYNLKYDMTRPYFIIIESISGDIKADLFIPSGFNVLDGYDVTASISEPTVNRESGCLTLEFVIESSVWDKKKCIFRCDDQSVDYYVQLDGKGLLDEGSFFQGYTAIPIEGTKTIQPVYRSKEPAVAKEAFPQASLPGFKAVFNPQPNHEKKQYFWFGDYSIIMASADHRYLGHQFHGGCWQLVPSPLCYAVSGESAENWMTIGLAVNPGEYNFSIFEYIGGSHFGLNVPYEGHTQINGHWETPHIIFSFADEEYAALKKYVDLLQEKGYIHFSEKKIPDWWKLPIVCGWGYECYLSTKLTGVTATDCATQETFEYISKLLEKHNIKPGMLIIDDKWQVNYGDPRVDKTKWSDMRGYIDSQHKKDIRVLLWTKIWDFQGIPVEECVTDENGKAVTVDPSNPAYEKRLRAAIHYMLSNDEGCLNADGFKLDYINDTPTGKNLKAFGTIWGIELLKKQYSIIYDEAKKIKADALIIGNSPNPYLADVIDILRLNDIHDKDEEIVKRMTHRAKVSRIACPEWLIDTDNWPVPNRSVWMEYMREQPKLGIPSMYYFENIYSSKEDITDDDYEEIRQIWSRYEEGLHSN